MASKRKHAKIVSTVGVVIAVTLAFGLVGTVSSANTTNIVNQYTDPNHDEPTVHCFDQTVSEGGSTTLGVYLTEAPNGLDGYSVTLNIDDPSVAEFDNETASNSLGFIGASSPTTVNFGAFAAGVSPGTTNILLGEVDVNGTSAGTTGISVVASSFVDSSNNAFSPNSHDCSVTVN